MAVDVPRYLVPFHPKRIPHHFCDVLIIGGGIAGLRAAMQIDPRLSILVITKDTMEQSNSAYAQGGIASVIDPDDNFTSHVELADSNYSRLRGTNVADQDRMGSEDGDQPHAAPPQAQQMQRVEVTDKHAISLYANFCRVTGTPEELILDFGLNAQPFGVPTEPVDVKQRIVVNYFTAKRMLQALHMSVQRHEQAFGVLETDVQKRVVAGRGGRPAAG